MEQYEHLRLQQFSTENQRKKRKIVNFNPYPFPENRDKKEFSENTIEDIENITYSFEQLKSNFEEKIDLNLIFKLKINSKVDYEILNRELIKRGISILNVVDNKKGYWIVFSDDKNLEKFRSDLSLYSDSEKTKNPFFNVIDNLENISKEEKIGELLKVNPISKTDNEYLNIELWRMDDERIENFLDIIQNTLDVRILDKLITKSFVLIRVRINKEKFEEIIEFREIAKIDRPFFNEFNPFEYKNIDINDLEIGKPEDDAVGILVIDSGIISNHPLLKEAVKFEENFQDGENVTHDTVGHGTGVSGNCIYGDVKKSCDEKIFKPSNYLFSAKIMYGVSDFQGKITAKYDPENLLEHQFQNAINFYLSREEYKIKVVNISFGNAHEIWKGHLKKQFPLASLIDELALFHSQVTFVISTGNCDPRDNFDSLQEIIDNYPNYLFDNENCKIINPATSSLSLTVGSISPSVRVFNRDSGTIWSEIAKENEPSPFSRSGGGVNNSIKPELVEYGGNLILNEMGGIIIENQGSNIAVLSNKITEELLTVSRGTSFSAPKISNLIGKIGNHFPNSSSNFMKNIVLQSTNYPIKKIENIFSGNNGEKKVKMLNTLGYGLPNFESAMYSYENQVLLFDENIIGLNKVKCYSFNLPEIFNETSGKKLISVVLTYNPITKATRGDSYFGNNIEFMLFHNSTTESILEKYSILEDINEELEEDVNQLKLYPGPRIRNSTCHQKAILEIKTKKIKNPLTLLIINRNKWINDLEHEQSYCISIMFKLEAEVDLYNQLKSEIQVRARVRN